jgi:hypothetical protein
MSNRPTPLSIFEPPTASKLDGTYPDIETKNQPVCISTKLAWFHEVNIERRPKIHQRHRRSFRKAQKDLI